MKCIVTCALPATMCVPISSVGCIAPSWLPAGTAVHFDQVYTLSRLTRPAFTGVACLQLLQYVSTMAHGVSQTCQTVSGTTTGTWRVDRMTVDVHIHPATNALVGPRQRHVTNAGHVCAAMY